MKGFFARKICYFCLTVVMLTSACREIIDLELPGDGSQLVIQGFLTYWKDAPQKNNCAVILSTTGNYYDENTFNPVTTATVKVTDHSNNITYLLSPLKNHPGLYQNAAMPIDSGHTYSLQVHYNQQEYEATGTVLPVAELDSFSYQYQEKRPFQKEGYYFYFSGRTPKERGINYYRFLIYKNDSLYNQPRDYLIQHDEFLKEKIDTLQLANYAFDAGDTVYIEMYSLNKNIYEYYNELLELLYNDGGLFSSPPRNPTSNINNVTNPERPPLGFFQVSSALGGGAIVEGGQ